MKLAEVIIFGTLAAGLHIGAGILYLRNPMSVDNETSATTPAIIAISQQAAGLAQAWDTPPATALELDQPPTVTQSPDRFEPVVQQMDATPQKNVAALATPKLEDRPDTPSATPSTPITTAPEQPIGSVALTDAPNIQNRTEFPVASAVAPPLSPAQSGQDSPEMDLAPPDPLRSTRANNAPPPRPQGLAAPTPNRAPVQQKPSAASKPTRSSPPAKQQDAPSAVKSWGKSIHRAVDRQKFYPNGTLAQGTTVLEITVTPAGKLTGVKIVSSSGDAKLDAAAVLAAKRAKLPRANAKMTKSQYRFRIPIKMQRR